MRPRRRGDERGVALAFEVLVLAMVVAVGLGAAMLLDPQPARPPPGPTVVRGDLLDALAHLDASSDAAYGTLLTRYVVEAVNHEPAGLDGFLRRVLPPGAGWKATLRADETPIVLSEQGAPGRSTVSASRLFHVLQDTAFLLPELSHYDGEAMGMGLHLVPLRNGYALDDRQVPLIVEVTTEEGVTYTTAAEVRVGDGPGASLGILDEQGSLHSYLSDDGLGDRIDLRLQADASAMPAGSTLTVRLPFHHEQVEVIEAGPAWSNVATDRRDDGWHITAELATDVETFADLSIRSVRPDPQNPSNLANVTAFDLVPASVDDGAAAFVQLVLDGKGSTTTLAAPFTRGVYLAAPRLLAGGSAAELGLVFANSNKDPSIRDLNGQCLEVCERIVRVEVRQPQEIPIFSGVHTDDWSLAQGHTLVWAGLKVLGSDDAAEFRVNVSIADLADGDPAHRRLEVTFPHNGHTENLTGMASEATFSGRIRPLRELPSRLPGYPSELGQGIGTSYAVCSSAQFDHRHHPGCATYKLSNLPSLAALHDAIQEGLVRSTFQIENATSARPGDVVTFRANHTGLLARLGDQPGFQGSDHTRFRLYHPWTTLSGNLTEWPAARQWEFLSPDPIQAAPWTIPRNVTYGTYVVVAERDIDLAGGSDVDQTIRQMGLLTIGSDNVIERRLVYWVTIEAWLPDWR